MTARAAGMPVQAKNTLMGSFSAENAEELEDLVSVCYNENVNRIVHPFLRGAELLGTVDK